MRVSQFGSRAMGLSVVFAMAGFAFALATSVTDSKTPDVVKLAVGTNIPLHYTTPNLKDNTGAIVNAQEYDMGDALYGSVIARFITAEGGIKPYRFVSSDTGIIGTSPNVPGLANLLLNTDSTLTLGLSGLLGGQCPGSISPTMRLFPVPPATLGNPGLRFHVTVTDSNNNNLGLKGSTSTPQQGNFNLALFDAAKTAFRFAIDSLPSARLDTPYFGKIDLLGGHTPVKVSSLLVTVKGTATPVKLSDLGMFLGPDGSLYGRPVMVGTFTIVAHAVDGAGAIARSRRNAGVFDQAFDLVVNDDPVTSSDTMMQKISIQGDTSQFGKDTLNVKGLINVLGQDQINLRNSNFSFQVGNISIAGTLDRNGKFVLKNTGGSTMTATVNARTGTLTVQASRGTFISEFDLTGIKDNDLVLRPVQIVVGGAVNSCEVIQFLASVSGTKYKFNFAQGKTGSNATGGFEIVSVRGRDALTGTGQPGDAWTVGFVAQPRLDSVFNPLNVRPHEGFNNIASINARIGAGFAQKMQGIGVTGAGPKIKFTGLKTDGVQSFKFDTLKANGTIVTRALASAGVTGTGVPTAATSLKYNNIFFPLGLDFIRGSNDAPFVGEHARRIFGFGLNFSDRPSARQLSPVQ